MNYGINGYILDVNNDGYDDVYGSITLYGGPGIWSSSLQISPVPQIPPGLNKISSAFYRTPKGEFRVVMHLLKKDSIDGYVLYRATWKTGSITPQFEQLDSIIKTPTSMQPSFFDGIGGVYQSKHHDKRYLEQ